MDFYPLSLLDQILSSFLFKNFQTGGENLHQLGYFDTLPSSLKAEVSEEILNWHSHSLSLCAEL